MVEHDVVDAVGAHLERWWVPTEALIWELGPMLPARPEFRVLRAESRDDGLWLYASAGASAERQVKGTGHEVFVVAREEATEKASERTLYEAAKPVKAKRTKRRSG